MVLMTIFNTVSKAILLPKESLRKTIIFNEINDRY
jgi:hypothetical protein